MVSLGFHGTINVSDGEGAILAERSCKLVGETWKVEGTLLVKKV